MKVLSLFDGISCGRVALERAGIPVETYYASEIDKYAIQIAQKNYPDTIQLGDVCKLDFTQYIGKVIYNNWWQSVSRFIHCETEPTGLARRTVKIVLGIHQSIDDYQAKVFSAGKRSQYAK